MHPKRRTELVNLGRGAAAAALLAGLGGCGSPHFTARSQPAAPIAATNEAPRPASPPPPTPLLAAAPGPVYRNPKIGVVTLRAHQDAEGRLFGPQVMYQVTDPGGWNLDAVEQGNAFIPAVNLEVPPNAGSPYVVPAREVPPLPSDAPLLDPARAARITVTGLMRPEDQTKAEAMAEQAGGDRSAIFDREAGWLLIPRR